MKAVQKNPAKKITLIGTGSTGKSCLLEVFKRDNFPTDYIPTIVDNFVKTIYVDGKELNLAMWDTAGQENYSSVRTISYSNSEIIMICYSIGDKTTLKDVAKIWAPEARNYCVDADVLLVGLKKDLRDEAASADILEGPIASVEAGRAMAEEIKALDFLECSARTRENVHGVFEAAGRYILKREKKKTGRRWYFLWLF